MTLLTTPPEMGTSRRTLLLAFRSSAGAAAATYLVNLAILPFVLHRVGFPMYGAWATVASILAVGALADAGVRTEIIRRVGAAKGADDEAALVAAVHQGVTVLCVLTVGLATAGLLGAPVVRGFAFPRGVAGYQAAEVDLLIRATVVLLTVSLVGKAYFAALRGIQRADVETTAEMLAVPVAAAVTVVGVVAGWGLWALFAGSAAQMAVTFASEQAGIRRLVPALRPRLVVVSGRGARAFLALSGLALLSQVSDVVDSQWDKLVLSHFVGSSAVASFQIGTSLVLQAKALALLPLAPLLAATSELRRRDQARMESLQTLLGKAGMILAAAVLGGVFVYAPSFIQLWLGPVDGSSATAARLFVVAVALNLVSAPLAFRAFGEGWHKVAAAGSVVNMVVNGALSLVLTVAIGFNGALYGSIAGNLAGTAVFLVLMHRRLGPRWTGPPLRALAVGCAAVGVMVATGLDRAGSWPVLCLSALAFVAAVLSAGAVVERLPVRRLLLRPRPPPAWPNAGEAA